MNFIVEYIKLYIVGVTKLHWCLFDVGPMWRMSTGILLFFVINIILQAVCFVLLFFFLQSNYMPVDNTLWLFRRVLKTTPDKSWTYAWPAPDIRHTCSRGVVSQWLSDNIQFEAVSLKRLVHIFKYIHNFIRYIIYTEICEILISQTCLNYEFAKI